MSAGSENYREAKYLVGRAHHFTYGDGADPVAGGALATEALVHAVLALVDTLTPSQPEEKDTREGESTPELTVYRAGFAGHDMPLGTYQTREAARAHCAAYARRENPIATLEWRPDGEWREGDDGEPGPDEAEELYAYGSHESATWDPTGYVVKPLEVASEYDAEADE